MKMLPLQLLEVVEVEHRLMVLQGVVQPLVMPLPLVVVGSLRFA
jgi:hypothetical protein